jgi:hypothetical protein
MGTAAKKISSEDVRQYVERRYIDDSRKKGVKRFTVNAGEVHRGLGLQNRVPLVCTALQSQKFLERHGLKLVEKSGPASGLSTRLNLTFEFAEEAKPSGLVDGFLSLRGIAKDVFASLGGGEKFIRAERKAFTRAMDKRERRHG